MKNRLDASMNYSLIKTDKEGTFKWDIFLLDHFHEIHERSEHMEDFENFLYVLTYILFVCLFIRSLVALYMGHWNLF